MFRRLFAIETAALHVDEDAVPCQHEQWEHPLGEALRDLTRFTAIPSCYGMWSSRPAS
jgi:hypothetical protein